MLKSKRQIEEGLEFGLTDDKKLLDAAAAFRDAALADGWTHKDKASDGVVHLTKEGFVLHVMTRENPNGNTWKYQAEVSIWGPDRLAIKPPDVYDWKAIQAGLMTCNECGATEVATVRFSFAGRACLKCLPEQKAKHEKGNWTA